MGADQHVSVAEREPRQDVGALASAFAAGENRDIHADGGGERRDGVEMLARQDFGRRHQCRLAAAFDHGRGGQQRHHGLAGADIALQQPQHAFGLGEIGDDLGDGARLRGGERVGQRSRSASCAGARCRRWRGRRGGADARAPARARAGRPGIRHRRAATRPTLSGCASAGSAGRCSTRSASREGRKALAGDPARVLPFGQIRHAFERGFGGLAHLVEAEPFGQRIDRLDQRQLGEIGFVDHAVGMHHLQHAVVEHDGARRRSAARRPAGAFPGTPCVP